MDSPDVSSNHPPTVSRRERRELLDEIGTGYLPIAEVLARAATDPVVARTNVRLLVQAFPGRAPAEIERVLTRAGITTGRRVGALAQWQRAVLIDALDSHPGHGVAAHTMAARRKLPPRS